MKRREREVEAETSRLLETPAAFARRLGVHKSTISRAISAGRLVLDGGFLDVEVSLRLWQATKPGLRPDVLARHAAKRSPAMPGAMLPAPAPRSASEDAAAAEAEDDDAATDLDRLLGANNQAAAGSHFEKKKEFLHTHWTEQPG